MKYIWNVGDKELQKTDKYGNKETATTKIREMNKKPERKEKEKQPKILRYIDNFNEKYGAGTKAKEPYTDKEWAEIEKPKVDMWDTIEKSMTPKERYEFWKDKPLKERPKDLRPPLPIIDVEGLTRDITILENNSINVKPEPIKPKPKRRDPDLDKGLGAILNVKKF